MALLAILIPLTQGRAADDFQDLLKRVPEQANAILLFDVQAIRKSPLAVRENWAKTHEQDYLAGMSRLPPTANKVVMAALFNPSSLDHTWKIGLVELKQDMALTKVAQAEAGAMDKVAGESVVLSPRNAYYISLAPRIKGMMHPANRQELARWIRFTKQNSRVVISPYLQKVAASAGETAPIVMAFDTTDILDPDGVRQRLKEAKALVGKPVNVDTLTNILSSLKGLKVTIRVDNAINGELRLDFDEPVAALAAVAKPLVLDALAGMGAAIEDLDDWSAQAEGKAIILRGKLSEQGARQIVSPFLTPAATSDNQFIGSTGQLEQDPKALASQRFYRSVATLLNELKQQKVKTFSQQAYWYYQAGQKIDELPILNVDEELLKYGASVSSTLRGLSNLSNTVATQNKILYSNAGEALVDAGGSYNYAYRYGNRGAAGYQYYVPNVANVNNYALIGNLMAQGTATEAAIRNQTWKNIDDAASMIRRKMVEKYKVEF
jgi:hypothetical protein